MPLAATFEKTIIIVLIALFLLATGAFQGFRAI
jgi:hypothetical protein